MIIGHLGTRAADLVDGRLSSRDEEDAWLHVQRCDDCAEHVKREAWVKQALSSLSSTSSMASATLKGRLADASALGGGVETSSPYDHPEAWLRPRPGPGEAPHRRRVAVAAVGAGVLGAAVLGLVTITSGPAQAPVDERRMPMSISDATETPGPSTLLPTGVEQPAGGTDDE